MSTFKRLLPLLLLSWCATACSTYRGVGAYKTAGDYAGAGGSSAAGAATSARGPSNFSPRAPFQLRWPVSEVHINRGFKPSTDPAHEGVDLGGPRGLPILAAHEGRVVYAGTEFRGYGKMVLLEYNHEWATLYAHLDTFAVKEGQIVRAGDTLGAMGSTGHATGVHLHFETLHNHAPTNPLPLLSRSPRLAALQSAFR